MHWPMILLAVVASTVVSSFTDWLFMGVLFRDQMVQAPEIWRPLGTAGERNKILISQVFGAVSCAAIVALCIWAGALTVPRALTLAVVVWIAAAAPLIAVNVTWIRMHPLVGASHAMGWLLRFAVTGVITALLV